MEVGVVVWVKGKGSNVGWLEGTLVAKVMISLSSSFFETFLNEIFRVKLTSQFVLMRLVKI
jgi:hypothetical protein